MKAALKVINDSLQKYNTKSSNLKSANAVVQKEWFTVSSTDSADPLLVEDYLDYIDNISTALFKHVVNMTDTNVSTNLKILSNCFILKCILNFRETQQCIMQFHTATLTLCPFYWIPRFAT